MPTTLKTAAESYLRAKALSRATRNEYVSTLRKWERWGGGGRPLTETDGRIHHDAPEPQVEGEFRDYLTRY